MYFLRNLVIGILLFVCGSFLVLKAPQIHADYLRFTSGSQIALLHEHKRGGGTGFVVRSDNGTKYTLTNKHVCEISIDGKHIKAKIDNNNYTLKILKLSKTHDLCALEAIPNKSGIKLAKDVRLGEELGILGHPKLFPLTLTRGQLIGYQNVSVATGVVASPELCPKNSEPVFMLFGFVCVTSFYAGLTTISALPGSSGSPVLDFYSNLTGVLFAASSDSNWGIIVPLSHVRDFLNELDINN